MSKALVVPRIHDNGTSPIRLMANLERVYLAINDMVQLCKEIAPNPRDYDPDEYERAIAQHARRVSALRSLQDEVEKEINLIQDQRC